MLDRVGNRGNIGGKEMEKGRWFVAAALVEANEDVFNFTGHHFVESTEDGGLASLLTQFDGRQLPVWNERPVDVSATPQGDWKLATQSKAGDEEREKKLRVRCHCGGIDFKIARLTPGEERDEHLKTRDERKWLGAHSASTSDRMTSSSPITSWVYVPVTALSSGTESLSSSAPGSTENLFGPTAKAFPSSKGVTRTFCGTCGASVAYKHEARPGVVGVAVGLLEDRGARAEDWVEWYGKVMWVSDAVWKGVADGLVEGMKSVPV